MVTFWAFGKQYAILSIEESGKKGVLRRLALAMNDEEISSAWKDYRTHTKKNILWLMPQLIAEGARRLDDFGSLFINEAEHPYILDQVKQISFYREPSPFIPLPYQGRGNYIKKRGFAPLGHPLSQA